MFNAPVAADVVKIVIVAVVLVSIQITLNSDASVARIHVCQFVYLVEVWT